MNIHLVDATYELFRSHFGAPPRSAPDGREVGATVGLVRSIASLLRQPDVSHVGCAFDHVVESFRNDLYDGYKTGEGLDPVLLDQFHLAERALEALGVVVWRGVEFEADDLIATAAERWRGSPGVEQIIICSPDKDLTQCVRGNKVICWDRRREVVLDEAGVVSKFGVPPRSIADLLGLVGDAADGFPGVPRWGMKSAARVLSRYGKIESIPLGPEGWDIKVRGSMSLIRSLKEHLEDAHLFKELAILRTDAPIQETLEELRWRGADRASVLDLAEELGDPNIGRLLPLSDPYD